MDKVCPKCQQNLDESCFSANRSRPDGKQRTCRVCYAKDYSAWYQSHKREQKNRNIKNRERNHRWVLKYLSEHPCVDCGESDPIVLEFDHIDETTKTACVATMVGEAYSIQRIADEVAKCVVRCANCHRRITAKRAGYYKYLVSNQATG